MESTLTQQLTLNIQLRDEATWDNFFPGNNQEIFETLQRTSTDCFYLWGNSGVGKTHLLQAAIHSYQKNKQRASYIPLENPDQLSPSILEGLEHFDVVCIDDIDRIAGNREWETALFYFYNRAKESRTKLIFSANCAPPHLAFQLADLQSRLAWDFVFQLQALDDDQCLKAVQHRANNRGLVLSDEVGKFLLLRFPRDMHSLFQLLETLDQAALRSKRRITIPFVKAVLHL